MAMKTRMLMLVSLIVLPVVAGAQPVRSFPLDAPQGLRLVNVTAEAATLAGQRGLRIVATDEFRRRMQAIPPQERDAALRTGLGEQLAIVEGITFDDGVIEAEIAGAPQADAGEGARGFVGIAFRVQDDVKTYDAFYLRPTNGRADDQLRRNHAAQYISHPEWTWSRLRNESPAKYESYVDLVPATWTKIRIEVRGTQARLYVHGQAQPTLIVNDVKTGPSAKGRIALWIDIGTEAYFRNLTVTPAAPAK